MAGSLYTDQELAVSARNANQKRYQDLKNRAEKSASTYDWNLFDPKTASEWCLWWGMDS